MIKINNQDVQGIRINGEQVIAVYTNGIMIWPDEIVVSGSSCYANGYWIDEYPWTDDTPWAD